MTSSVCGIATLIAVCLPRSCVSAFAHAILQFDAMPTTFVYMSFFFVLSKCMYAIKSGQITHADPFPRSHQCTATRFLQHWIRANLSVDVGRTEGRGTTATLRSSKPRRMPMSGQRTASSGRSTGQSSRLILKWMCWKRSYPIGDSMMYVSHWHQFSMVCAGPFDFTNLYFIVILVKQPYRRYPPSESPSTPDSQVRSAPVVRVAEGFNVVDRLREPERIARFWK